MSNYCNAIINHDNCEFDANCGLTCNGIVQRELTNDPSFVITPEFYDDFMQNCALYYWPSGCPGTSSSSGTSEGTEFNKEEFISQLNQGFTEFYPALILIFATFCIIKLITMVGKP
jgi:hypothetical protein